MTSSEQVTAEAPAAGAGRRLGGLWQRAFSTLAVTWCLYQIVVTMGWIIPNALAHRALHLLLAQVIVFWVFPAYSSDTRPRPGPVDLALVLGTAAFSGYTAFMQQFRQDEIVFRSGDILGYELILGAIAILTILEATRRLMGLALPLVAFASIVYAYAGVYLPGGLATRSFSIEWILRHLYAASGGIWGPILGVSATDVFMFVLFATFFSLSGVGQMINTVAMGWFGAYRGGPAKVAVVSSGFFGMLSGAAVANIVTTGAFTIPMMKRVGYKPHFAGAVEACASTGGMFTPPMMGAAAFLMAQYLGVDYGTIVLAAIMPALLFYVGVYYSIDLEAQRHGLRGLSAAELPRVGPAIRQGWHLFLPLVLLMYLLLVQRFPAARAALYGIGAMSVIYLWSNRRAFPWRDLVRAAERASLAAVTVAVAAACIGILLGMIELTGVGIRLSSGLLQLSGGSLPILLLLTMVASLILGLGLTPAACYMTLAILVAPTLVTMGVPPLAAHFFVFIFGIISMLTPPVAVSAYVAGSLAGAPLMRTGWTAFKIALPTFIVPYMFVYGPELLGIGLWWQVAVASITAVLGTIAFTAGIQGWIRARALLAERVLLVGAAVLLLGTGLLADGVGIAVLGGVWLMHRWRLNRRGRVQATTS